jgi:penicillin amidase
VTSRTKLLLGLAGLLVVLGLSAFLFFRYQIRKSFPETTGTLPLPGLHAVVTVSRDTYGVPLIDATDEHDLLMAQGFVHAQDRLWQMDLVRRTAQGRLSELFGASTVPFDRMFRIVGLRRIADSLTRALPRESLERMQWYTDGVNAYIDGHRGRLPVEFDLLRYAPEPWTPAHTLQAARLLAWELNLSWWSDIALGCIADRVGVEKALDVFPSYPATVAPEVPSPGFVRGAGLARGYFHTAREYAEATGRASMLGGSNAWVVAPARSASGRVILANDTHLHLTLPSQWYEAQLRSPGWNVRGMSIPGVPGIVAGRNERIAWGVTNLMADDADFYIERVDSTDTLRVQFEDAWEPMTVLHEEIGVRGDSTVPLTIRITRHGPVVTDIRTMLNHAVPGFVASMRWTGAEVDDQIGAFLAIDRARTWQEFAAGVKRFGVPGQNFVYGDVDGTIGYWCGVRLPIRGPRSSLFPLPGWERASEWKGFVPFENLPHLLNPPEGFIASANNKTAGDAYPYHISHLWEPPARIVKLREVLGRPGERFTVEDFERLQNNAESGFARQMLPHLLAALHDTAGVPVPEAAVVEDYLRNWNCTFAVDDIATSIFQAFLVRLLADIYRDEMGDDLFHDFVTLVNIPIRVTTRLLEEGDSPWFDDVSTPAVETRDDILRRSMREALADLRRLRGDDTRLWRWGDLHTVTLQHPFGLVKPLDRIFNVGPHPFPGASTALISGEYSMTAPFAVTVGPSFRQIFDMGNPAEVRAILPSGQSGQVFHEHYADQTALWLHGGYRVGLLHTGSGKWERLTLEPAP